MPKSDSYPEGKYIVCKRTDQATAMIADYAEVIADDLIEDAVVIRQQDVFAAPALHMYSMAMGIAIEAMYTYGGPKNQIGVDQLLALRDAADYFHQAATAAERSMTKKLPD